MEPQARQGGCGGIVSVFIVGLLIGFGATFYVLVA